MPKIQNSLKSPRRSSPPEGLFAISDLGSEISNLKFERSLSLGHWSLDIPSQVHAVGMQPNAISAAREFELPGDISSRLLLFL
jgi:hypothetical protein